MQQLTYFISCSLDGFIARNDHSFDGWSLDAEYLAEIGKRFPETYPAHLRTQFSIAPDTPNKYFDTVLMGKNTYDNGAKFGIMNPYPHLKQYLFSSSIQQSPDANVELVSGNNTEVGAMVKRLKETSGKGIWLCGGGELASTLFAAQLIDRLWLKINPFVMGEGIPLFSQPIPQGALSLVNHSAFANGVLLVEYLVQSDR